MKVTAGKNIGHEEALHGFVAMSRRMVAGFSNPKEGAELLQPLLEALVETRRISSDQAAQLGTQLKQQTAQVWGLLETQMKRIVQDTVLRLKNIADHELTELEQRLGRLESTKTGKIQVSKTI